MSARRASNRSLLIFAGFCLIFMLIGVQAQLHGGSGGAIDPGHRDIIPLYVGTMAGEWITLFFVWRALRSSGTSFVSLAGRWNTPLRALTDLVLGLAIGGALLLVDAALAHVLGANTSASIDPLLPRGPLEAVLWIGVSLTAGISEEFIYRGFLLRELEVRLPGVPFAILAQGLWFGIMHAYEGLHAVIAIVLIGVIFGAIAVRLKRLAPNMVAHTAIDLIGGLAPRLVPF